MSRDIKQMSNKTLALVTRRTNYGEADRILNLITPVGKMVVMARGVRKEKSKLAGGIEMFTLSEVVVHDGRGEMGVLTGAKMVEFYDGILKDYARVELGSAILKRVGVAAESVDSPELFGIAKESLQALNLNVEVAAVEMWFLLNIARVMGEQVNLYYDATGEKLVEEARYNWDPIDGNLVRAERGEIDANAIKIMRVALSNRIMVMLKIKGIFDYVPAILRVAKSVNKL